jgi:hypothetical protein
LASSSTGHCFLTMFLWYPVMDLARAPRRTARKKGSGYENGVRLVNLYFKGRLQSLLRMSVIVFAWARDSTGSWASRFILGPVSFLAITRALFFSQAKEWSSKSVPKYIELFWATIRQITSSWGNMTSRKEYHASRDASKVYQSVFILLFSSMETACHFCLRFPMAMIYLHPQASTKGFQEKNPRRIGHFTQHSCYSLPSLWILQWNRLLKPINRGFNDYKILYLLF